MKIRQLPDILANKIAAGEVVERPASVVKELMENSIDAESTVIKIAIQEAGLKEIKVTDNGIGMEPEDCQRAFLRHATSKIMYDQDLFHIKSLGFRGEALASIASVSKLSVTSSTGDQVGTELYLEAGSILKTGKSDARRGTEITVSELFYNTPARLKYMKSIHTELGHITDIVNRYALAHPHIRFEVSHNGKVLFKTAGSNQRLQVIQQIYGMEIAKNMFYIQDESLDFKVEGYIAKPEMTRANRHYITIIVNGRFVKSHPLTHAIIRAYDTLLPIHRYPIAVISIMLDPILVDVNVHPTKLEIRFSKEKELTMLIQSMVNQAFKKSTLIPKIEKKPKSYIQTEQKSLAFDQFISNQQADMDSFAMPVNEKIQETAVQNVEPILPKGQDFLTPIPNNKENEQTGAKDRRVPAMYPIGQLQGTYILAQNENGLYMIDQHAAQERIKYEYFKKQLATNPNNVQQLLMPLTFEFTHEEILFIEKYGEQLEEAGLFLEAFGGQTYAVKAHPNWFPQEMAADIIRDMVEQIIQNGTIQIGSIREEVAILMACKRSIKANHYLNERDMNRLLEDLSKTRDPFTCPHGRPVIVHFTYYEIEKMFKRIM